MRFTAFFCFFVFFLFSSSLINCAIPGHLIAQLPGYQGKTPSLQYSGLLPASADQSRWLHYWLVLSEHNPATDPLVIWQNGVRNNQQSYRYKYRLFID
jgi:hypothetical protein